MKGICLFFAGIREMWDVEYVMFFFFVLFFILFHGFCRVGVSGFWGVGHILQAVVFQIL